MIGGVLVERAAAGGGSNLPEPFGWRGQVLHGFGGIGGDQDFAAGLEELVESGPGIGEDWGSAGGHFK